MFRRLVLFGIAVVASALVALIIPLALVARDVARAEQLQEAREQAQTLAVQWRQVDPTGADGLRELTSAAVLDDATVTLVDPGGTVVGPVVPEEAAGVVRRAQGGVSTVVDTGGPAYAAESVPLSQGYGVVLVTATAAEMGEGMLPRAVALTAVSLSLLGFAGITAWLLARRTARPIRRLASTADAIADGDLSARMRPTSIPEVNDVGRAMNRMADRVQELLADERENAAELAHQLRTPLTVLAADIDAVADPELRARLQEDVLALQQQTDEIIVTARRSTREGLRAESDAAVVVARRVEFWQVLAEDQGRSVELSLAPGPLPVRLTAEDLGTIIDILLQNVFIHTPEGTGYRIAAHPSTDRDGFVTIEVTDDGPGLGTGDAAGTRPGSTGLGLSIAEKLARATGGRLILSDNEPGLTAGVELGAC